MAQPVKIYILHHHSDSKDMNMLSTQLEMLRKNLIQTWSAEDMKVGEHRDEAIRRKLAESSIILALISPDYLADSEYCVKIQQDAHRAGKIIIPIILRNCLWDMDDILEPLNPLPHDGGTLKVASQWDKKEDAFASVVRHIRSLFVGEMTKTEQQSSMISDQSASVKTILFIGASPNNADPLALGREIRGIREQLRKNNQEKAFFFADEPAVRTSDIQHIFIQHKPTILHFSGHGDGEGGLVFEDALGNAKLVRTEALDSVFNTFKKSVECVILNACYSDIQAEVISKHIPYVIGMPNQIPDDTALSFSWGFYLGLGAGENYEMSFEMGKNQMKIDGFFDWEPILLVNKR